MKKITILMLFLSTVWSYAQVKRYTFAKSTGNYAEISGGTALGNQTSDSQCFVDPTATSGSDSGFTGVGLPIGFNFTFNGYIYDKFGVSTDGWISLGSSASGASAINMTINPLLSPLASTSTVPTDLQSAKIAALAKDLMAQEGSSIRFETIGDAPNRVLVVQWKKYKKGSSYGTGDDFNFQIRLNETTNKVDIMYGLMLSNSSESANKFQVGLRAEPRATLTNFANRKSTTGWNNTVEGTVPSDTVLMNDLFFPSNGLTFTWTPPTCGGPNGLVASSITGNGVTLNWGAYLPVPESYEYIVSTSDFTPLSGTAGTATTSPSVTLTKLDSSTGYYVFLRSKCGSGFTPWTLGGTFKTLCLDATYLYEDFDSYSSTAQVMPDCWAKTGTTGTCFVQGNNTTPLSPPNRLYMFANKTIANAVLPAVTNLQAGTHRIRFKAYGTANGKIQIGYLDSNGVFKALYGDKGEIALSGMSPSNAQEFTYAPMSTAIPEGVKNLVISNQGSGTASLTAYIDNVFWEPVPACADIMGLVGKKITPSSIDLSWTKGGSETQWQYIYGSASQSPQQLTPVDVSSSEITVNGLTPGTKYKMWVRSKCSDGAVGSWIGPIPFTTACSFVSQFMDNFDGSAANLPSCWTKVGTAGTVSPFTPATAPLAPSASNVLQLNMGSASTVGAVVSLPPVSNPETAMLSFKVRGSVEGAKLDIGYLTDLSDPSSFNSIETITCGSTAYQSLTKTFGADFKSPYLAFRNLGAPVSVIYLDDIAWEPIPTCPDISGVTAKSIKGTSVDITWNPGETEAWQYAIGPSTATSPFGFTPVDVVPASTIIHFFSIDKLTPSTSYKVWMRSKCGNNTLGSWKGPVDFTTTCAPVSDFTQTFDTVELPSCWVKVGSGGTINTYVGMPSTNSLGLRSRNGSPIDIIVDGKVIPGGGGTLENDKAICAMVPVNNSADGTYRLKFKYKTSIAGSVLDIGYVTDLSNPDSFVSLKSITSNQTTSYELTSVQFGMDPASEVLAFRNADPFTSIIYIDDVVWEPIPSCSDIKNLVSTGVTGTSINIDWDAGELETKWQYAIGSPSLADASSLTPVDVTSISAATINGLSSSMTYKIWVRAKCSSTAFGPWSSSIIVSTVCPAVDSFTENFDSSSSLPSCWNRIGATSAAWLSSVPGTPSGTSVLNLATANGHKMSMISMPQLANAGSGDRVLKFKYNASVEGSVLQVGYLTNQWDPTSFVIIESITVDSTTGFKLMTIKLSNSPLSNILAFKNMGLFDGSIYLDDVSWELDAKTVPACASTTALPNANCGNFASKISWQSVAGADGYILSIGTTSGGTQIVDKLDTVSTSYTLVGNPDTKYYYKVVPYNSFGSAVDCVEQFFKTNANSCYCPSVPSTHDAQGITNITLGASSYTGSNKSYYDFTSTTINLARGTSTKMPVTFDTNGVIYNVHVYIDFNDNYVFESSEGIYIGLSKNEIPSTVNGSFTIPAGTKLGIHAMRLRSVDWQLPVDPCYNGEKGVTVDFKVNVVDAVEVAPLAVDSFDNAEFVFYPNPVKDVLNLSFNQEIKDVSVVNLLGQQVISKSVNADQDKIDFSQLSAGTYLVKIAIGNQFKTIKVMKE